TALDDQLSDSIGRRRSGVDLSAGMLVQAKDKQLYDELLQTELTAYLQQQAGAFDIIVSAHTLVYFRDLAGVIAAAAGALRAGGLFIFTLEHDEASPDFVLRTHGRYTHARAYVERLLADYGCVAGLPCADDQVA